MKQDDAETRKATARIMDFFSGGVCLRNWLALTQAEFAIHICRTFGIEESERPAFSSWTKIGYWAGEHTFQFPNLPAEESTAMEKLYIDLSWEMSLEHYQAMPDRIPTPDAFEIAWIKEAERSQANQTVVKSNFTKLVRQKRLQLLSALKENLIPMMSVCKNVPGNPNDHVSAALDPIYGGLDPKAVPSLEVVAALDAAIALESKRKVQANDMLDYLHAAQALPYCDALFCDNFMSQKMRNKPLEFGALYDTEIGSRPEEILGYLNGLT